MALTVARSAHCCMRICQRFLGIWLSNSNSKCGVCCCPQLGLAAMRESGVRSSTHAFLKPVKNQNAWRLILGVLDLLQVGAKDARGFRVFQPL